MTFFLLIVGLIVLAAGAELLVRGASRLALAFGISPLVVGLTVVAFGTSAPEAAVSVKAAFANQPDLVVGNCLGSTMFNVLFILGLCALVAPLVVSQQLVRLDVPIMIAAHVVFLLMALDGSIGWWDGLLLLAGLGAYVVFGVRKSQKESPAVQQEYKEAFQAPPRTALNILIQLALVAGGIACCVLGARWLLEGSIALARMSGVSELVIGLTIIAAGTSLPELATSIVATYRGQRDIAIGNVVGSNIFNILGIIGLAGVVAPRGVNVSPAALGFDLPVAIATCVACLPIFFTGHKIARWEGGLFFGYYIAYAGYLILAAQQHDVLPLFSSLMLWFVIPITVVTLGVLTWRSRRSDLPSSSK
jgi:cation:H+ antiporter